MTLGMKIGVHSAVFASEQPICFLKDGRGTTLGALMFDEKIDGLLRYFFTTATAEF
jgi:hypothetical protein